MADEPSRYQETSAGGDAYVAGRDIHIHNLPPAEPRGPRRIAERSSLVTWLRRVWPPRRSR